MQYYAIFATVKTRLENIFVHFLRLVFIFSSYLFFFVFNAFWWFRTSYICQEWDGNSFPLGGKHYWIFSQLQILSCTIIQYVIRSFHTSFAFSSVFLYFFTFPHPSYTSSVEYLCEWISFSIESTSSSSLSRRRIKLSTFFAALDFPRFSLAGAAFRYAGELVCTGQKSTTTCLLIRRSLFPGFVQPCARVDS